MEHKLCVPTFSSLHARKTLDTAFNYWYDSSSDAFVMSQIEDIKNRIDIVDLISSYVQLNPGGANFKARCPFHNEKSASFMVSREKGIWHCFGCGKGGDIFSFVQEIENMEFREALQLLAQKAGVELQRDDPKERTQKQRYLDINALAAKVFHRVLLEHEKAELARKYLLSRGVTDESVRAFTLGYAPESWEGVSKFLRSRGFAEEEIFHAGLTIKRDRGVGFYDRFRNRLMFPITDHLGRVIGFGGRALAPDQTPKYVNTPQTSLYNKSATLFAIDKAKTAIKQQNVAIVVEGYMDALASHQVGVTNVVASSGTALTRDQLHILKRYTENIALSFDTDAAGESASGRGIDLAWEEGLNVKVVVLPFGKDPDELIHKDAGAWKKAATEAQPFMEYAFARVQAQLNLFSVEGKKSAAKRLLPLIARLTDTIEQTHYLQKLSRLLNVAEDLLRTRIAKTVPKQTQKGSSIAPLPEKKDVAKSRVQRIAEQLLAIASADKEHLEYLIDHLEPESLAATDLLGLYKALITYYTKEHSLDQREFLEALQREDRTLAERAQILFLLGTSDLLPQDQNARRAEVLEGVSVLKKNALQAELGRLRTDLERAEHEKSPDIQTLSERVRDVTNQLAGLQ